MSKVSTQTIETESPYLPHRRDLPENRSYEVKPLFAAMRELWSYRELVYNLVVRDLKVRYKNSFLGVVWSWLNPLLMMLIFTLVFNFLWTGQGIANYHIFFLSGILPWQFFTSSVMGGITSVVGNGHLLKKVYFPREILPISVVLSCLINFVIALPVFFALALLSGQPITFHTLLLPLPILIETIFILGIVLLLSALEVFYRDTHMVMDVVIQGMFFMTPIIYTMEQISLAKVYWGVELYPRQLLYWVNPMASIINTYHDLLYKGEITNILFLGRTAVTALIVLLFGYWVFRRCNDRFGELV